MKNVITCKSCGAENPFYGIICTECKSYLRERIVNIDLFNVTSLLIHSPREAFTQIIRAEHKNFIFFLLLLASAKFLVNSMYIALAVSKFEPNFGSFVELFYNPGSRKYILICIFAYSEVYQCRLRSEDEDQG